MLLAHYLQLLIRLILISNRDINFFLAAKEIRELLKKGKRLSALKKYIFYSRKGFLFNITLYKLRRCLHYPFPNVANFNLYYLIATLSGKDINNYYYNIRF
jgi:hypothetical protein